MRAIAPKARAARVAARLALACAMCLIPLSALGDAGAREGKASFEAHERSRIQAHLAEVEAELRSRWTPTVW